MAHPTHADLEPVAAGRDPRASLSLGADAYTDPSWLDPECEAVLSRSWQRACHAKRLREGGAPGRSGHAAHRFHRRVSDAYRGAPQATEPTRR